MWDGAWYPAMCHPLLNTSVDYYHDPLGVFGQQPFILTLFTWLATRRQSDTNIMKNTIETDIS